MLQLFFELVYRFLQIFYLGFLGCNFNLRLFGKFFLSSQSRNDKPVSYESRDKNPTDQEYGAAHNQRSNRSDIDTLSHVPDSPPEKYHADSAHERVNDG